MRPAQPRIYGRVRTAAAEFTAASFCGGLAERAKFARDPLDRPGADADLLGDLQHAVASLQKAQDAPSAQRFALVYGPLEAGMDTLLDRRTLRLMPGRTCRIISRNGGKSS